MKINKISAALISAALMTSVPFGSSVYAVDMTPVYEDFNSNDVNGRVIINLPETVKASVVITFDSPEWEGEPYYTCEISGSDSFSFDIEGRNNTEDDYRNYKISVSLSGGIYDAEAGTVTDEFTIYDPNDTPKSFTTLTYNFTIDDKATSDTIELTDENSFGGVDGDYTVTKDYALHLNGFLKGDVDGDGVVTGIDATRALRQYTLVLSGMDGELNELQKAAADIDGDGVVTGIDATYILRYYTHVISFGSASWDNL